MKGTYTIIGAHLDGLPVSRGLPIAKTNVEEILPVGMRPNLFDRGRIRRRVAASSLMKTRSLEEIECVVSSFGHCDDLYILADSFPFRSGTIPQRLYLLRLAQLTSLIAGYLQSARICVTFEETVR